MSDVAVRFKELKELFDQRSGDDLVEAVQAEPGGIDGTLDTVFEAFAGAFNPEKAGGDSAVFQYDIDTPEGTRSYHLVVADGTCASARGAHEEANVTIGVKLPDMLHMASGKLPGSKAFITGKLKVRGNPLYGMKMGDWFDQA